ncbi:MAG: hypothetical protein V4507_14715, partial [Verrucomicrobiota bacterium]
MQQSIPRKIINRLKQLFGRKKSEDFYTMRPSKAIAAEIWKSQTPDRLIDLTLAAVAVARKVSHRDIVEKMKSPPYWPEIWPGEKYKLLSGIVATLKPSIIVEIGTAQGLSIMSMKKFLPQDGKIFSFDVRPWNTISGTVLTSSDFEDGHLIQINEDLGDKMVFSKHAAILRQASLIFIDVGNDDERNEEKRFLENFESLDFATHPIFILNDIRLEGMIDIWHNVKKPKLDVTSFGHWSGNGLID